MLICPECGYDLHGLKLPHPCPECGRVSDPTRDHDAAVGWFGSWRGLLFRRPPPMVTDHLSDPRCRAIARRRIWLLGVLPGLLSTAALLGLFSLIIERDLAIWWETPQRPGVQLQPYETTEQTRPLQFELHLRGMFRLLPPNSIERTEVLAVRYKWGEPALEPFAFDIGIIAIPALSLLSIPCLWLALRVAERWRGGSIRRIRASGSLMPLVGLLTPWYLLCDATLIHHGLWSLFGIARGIGESLEGPLALFTPCVWFVYLIPGAVLMVRALRGLRPRRRNYPIWFLTGACVAWFAIHIGVWILLVSVADLSV